MYVGPLFLTIFAISAVIFFINTACICQCPSMASCAKEEVWPGERALPSAATLHNPPPLQTQPFL